MRQEDRFAVEYGYWFNMMSERLSRRADFVLNFVQLVGGSGAAFAAIGGWAPGVVLSGLLLAVCAATSLLLQPAVQAERFCVAKGNFLDLKARAGSLSDAVVTQELARLQKEGPNGLGGLTVPAWNAAARALGADQNDLRKVSGWPAFLEGIA